MAEDPRPLLPRRGMLIDVDGSIKWSWEENTGREFREPPPLVQLLDGTMGLPTLDMIVLDCDAEFAPGDMPLIHESRRDCRVRKNAQGKWEFFLQIIVKDAADKDVMVEVRHPIEAIREARKKAKEPV